MRSSSLSSETLPIESAHKERWNLPPAYVDMLHCDGHDNPPAFIHAAARIFHGVDLRGKRVLEIGSGRGLMALYAGLRGAAQGVSLEPELAGATSGVIAVQRQRIETLEMRNIVVVPADFNSWNAGSARFDVILSRASINHLYQSNHHALRDAVTYENYVRIARKIHGLLAPGGVFVATDACRYAFFTRLRQFGIPRPWRWKKSGVDWRHHQNPSTWRRIFGHAGFNRVSIDYPVPYRLRWVSALVDNAVANFFLNGSFILRAYRYSA